MKNAKFTEMFGNQNKLMKSRRKILGVRGWNAHTICLDVKFNAYQIVGESHPFILSFQQYLGFLSFSTRTDEFPGKQWPLSSRWQSLAMSLFKVASRATLSASCWRWISASSFSRSRCCSASCLSKLILRQGSAIPTWFYAFSSILLSSRIFLQLLPSRFEIFHSWDLQGLFCNHQLWPDEGGQQDQRCHVTSVPWTKQLDPQPTKKSNATIFQVWPKITNKFTFWPMIGIRLYYNRTLKERLGCQFYEVDHYKLAKISARPGASKKLPHSEILLCTDLIHHEELSAHSKWIGQLRRFPVPEWWIHSKANEVVSPVLKIKYKLKMFYYKWGSRNREQDSRIVDALSIRLTHNYVNFFLNVNENQTNGIEIRKWYVHTHTLQWVAF